MDSVSINISYDIVDKGSSTKEAHVSVKIRLSYQRQQKRYALPHSPSIIIPKSTFAKLLKYHESQNNRVSEEIRGIYNNLKPHIKQAQLISSKITPFSFIKFKEKFYAEPLIPISELSNNQEYIKPEGSGNVHKKLIDLQKRNHAEDRINNGDLFQAVSNSLIRYQKGSLNLNWDDITPEFLANYERWMLVKGKAPKSKEGKPGPTSINTVGIYLRQLRTAFNSAIEEGKATREQYPFKDKFTIPAAEGNPKALDKEHIKLILNHTEEEGSLRQRSLDLWIFTYLCNGINMMDICNLRWANVNLRGREIVFKRQKTIRTRKKNMKDIKVLLNNRTIQIIDRWSGPVTANGHVFPFLNDDMTAKRKRAVVDQILKLTNDHMSKIGEGLGIPADAIRTYEARHSFGTILMQAGNVPIKFISDAMGHSSYKTTESYLSRFRDEQIKDYMSNLTNFDIE